MTKGRSIVAVGGTLRAGSSTERAMQCVLNHAAERGAETRIFAGEAINLPMFAPGRDNKNDAAVVLIEALRAADAIVLGSPGYHGGVSGLVKNAIDYTEEMAKDLKPYFAGKAVGCIATGAGWQGCNATLHALRSITHALRGWPTPLGIAFNSVPNLFDDEGRCLNPDLDRQFEIMANELLAFAAA